MIFRIETVTLFVDRMHAILADESVDRLELSKEEYTVQEISGILNCYLAESKSASQRADMLQELVELTTQAAASLTLTTKALALLYTVNHAVNVCSAMVRGIDEALQKGVHARRAALEAQAHAITAELLDITTELRTLAKDEELKPVRIPEDVEWVALARVLAVLNHPDYYWGNTNASARCKYLTLRIDTRDNHCVVMDGRGQMFDIALLEEACLQAPVPNMNENVCPRTKSPTSTGDESGA